MKKNLLVIKGGGSTEHEITFLSAEFLLTQIDTNKFEVFEVIIDKNFNWEYNSKPCELNFNKELVFENQKVKMDMALPCLHGYPGETGDIQSFFELIKLPYFGCGPEASLLCFNKLATKLLLELGGIKTTPFTQINSLEEIDKANTFINEHKVVYVKATNQGSSIGCYRVDNLEDLKKSLTEAFTLSSYVILEKEILGRELEVAAFEHEGKLNITRPGEIVCPSNNYTYEEKYSEDSNTQTLVEAPNITDQQIKEMSFQATKAFEILRLRHLSRIDFFLSNDGEIFINEINTFPGHTAISMFPLMLENTGIKYSDYINKHLSEL